MKNTYYLIRLDDACPTMDKAKWNRIEDILNKYEIKPMIGIIPKNNDVILDINEYDYDFWSNAKIWQQKGWTIALHGYDHVYLTNEGGINPVHKRSEFAGLSIKEQEQKIENGVAILKENGLYADYFFAPSHTFDENTIKALKNKSEIRRICDTIGTTPYRKEDIIYYPQQFGSFKQINCSGYWTFCFHPNNVEESFFDEFESFISSNRKRFISFNSIDVDKVKRKKMIDHILSLIYFTYRFIKS